MANKNQNFITRLFSFRESGLVGVILILMLLLILFSGSVTYTDDATGKMYQINKFLQPGNIDKLVKNTSFFAIMAVGVTFTIITGGIDLSIGSIYCLAAVVGAMFLNHFGPGADGTHPVPHPRLIVMAGIFICLSAGLLCGLVNGFLITALRLHPFIITLGTMAIYRGIAFIMTKAQAFTFFPPQFTDGMIRYQIGPHLYPVPMLIMILVAIIGHIFLLRTITGRYIYAVGGNETASQFSGINVSKTKILVYGLSGLTAGIAAMIMLGYYGAASSDVGKGYELDVIAACVVGGASLTGGRGSALGALLGALIIHIINNSIVILDIDQNYSQVIIGTVIIIAVFIDQMSVVLRERRLKEEARRAQTQTQTAPSVD